MSSSRTTNAAVSSMKPSSSSSVKSSATVRGGGAAPTASHRLGSEGRTFPSSHIASSPSSGRKESSTQLKAGRQQGAAPTEASTTKMSSSSRARGNSSVRPGGSTKSNTSIRSASGTRSESSSPSRKPAAAPGDWNALLEQSFCGSNLCFAAGMANRADGQLYAVAPTRGDKGWGYLYAEPQPRRVNVDETTQKKVQIDEAQTLVDTVERDLAKKGPSRTGLWLGGRKYRVVNRDSDFRVSPKVKLVVLSCAAEGKRGCTIAATKQTIVVGCYHEVKGQTGQECRKAVVDYATWLAEQGL